MRLILIGLGSNIGEREIILHRAADMLRTDPHIAAGQFILSSLYQTPALLPEGAPADWDMPFLNAVCAFESAAPAIALLQRCQHIEREMGRIKRGHWGPRELDLDLLACGEERMATPALTLPHPAMTRRDFVLRPLAEILPGWRYPGDGAAHGKTAAELLESMTENAAPARRNNAPPASGELSAANFGILNSGEHKVHVITGPTCCGKSAYALRYAAKHDGIIINADAMQVYADLAILTARPTAEEMRHAPHRLYGFADALKPFCVAEWITLATDAIRACWQENKLPILVGGTGMYLRALMQGIADIPDIPADIRDEMAEKLRQLGNNAFHRWLATIDPVMAGRLHPSNTQRLLRAAEVMQATGRSLAAWQDAPSSPPLPDAHFSVQAVAMERATLYARINTRFEAMLEAGGIEEAARLKERADTISDTSRLPALRAHGVPELFSYLDGTMPLPGAIAQAQQNTRNYAKRQGTWIRHQFPQAERVEAISAF